MDNIGPAEVVGLNPRLREELSAAAVKLLLRLRGGRRAKAEPGQTLLCDHLRREGLLDLLAHGRLRLTAAGEKAAAEVGLPPPRPRWA